MTQPISIASVQTIEPRDTLFFAFFPDRRAIAALCALAERLRKQHGLKGRTHPAEKLHVTLHHLGDFAGLAQDGLVRACEAAHDVMSEGRAVDLQFDRVMSFPGKRKRPVVLRGDEQAGIAQVVHFQRLLGESLTAAGLERYVEPGFKPHVTLLYDERALVPGPVPTVGWTSRELFLVRSVVGQGRYVAIARWAFPDD